MRQVILWLILVVLTLLLWTACRPVTPTDSSGAQVSEQQTAPAQVATPTRTPTPTPKPTGGVWAVPTKNLPTPPGRPPDPPPPFRSKPPANLEEANAWQKEMEDKGLIHIEPVYGPTKKGVIIRAKGIDIKLPDDAYVEYRVISVDVPVNLPQPELPYYIIVRGSSRISVTERTGRIIREITVPGEENAFDFLKKALGPEAFKTPAVTPVPPTPVKELPPCKEWENKVRISPEPESLVCKGGVLKIKAMSIKLPDDAIAARYVGDVQVSGKSSRQPFYIIVRGESRIQVTEQTGNIITEIVAPGKENAFDFLKKASQ